VAGVIRSAAVRRLVLAVAVALAGLGVAEWLNLAPTADPSVYMYGVTFLLALGLYGSAYGITREVTQDLRTVVLAVTVGVVLKTVLIAAVMWVFYQDSTSLLLGVAVAQIDPLSVAALIGGSRMTRRAKNVLLAWASFDDPITALLTIYLSALMMRGGSGGMDAYLMTAWGNFVLVLFALVLWFGGGLLRRRVSWPVAHSRRVAKVVALILLGVAMYVAVTEFLLLGIALMGLFFRPWIETWLGRVTFVAFLLATFAMGMLLVGGVDWGKGLVLGAAAFGAQILIGGLVIGRRLTGVDRIYLALGQQNGITAILLALALLPAVPQAVAVIAPAVLTVNVIHMIANGLWERLDAAGQERVRFRLRMGTAAEAGVRLAAPDPPRMRPSCRPEADRST
jgi:hypothetical protein